MVAGIAQQKAALGLMDDEANVTADAHGPEVFVLRAVNPVEAHSRIGGIDLKIERGGLDGLLLIAGEAREAVGKRVGYAEVH